jgi:hypothetical protein
MVLDARLLAGHMPSGVAKDIKTSKTGAITLTVLQVNGERFKTLAKNIEIK